MEKKRLQHISLLLFLTYFLNLCVPCLAVQAEAIFAPVSLTEEVTFDLLTEKSSSPDSFTEAEATLASPEESFIGDASFGDIAGHWAENGIKIWTTRELAGGYPDGTFRPDSPITRAEFLTLVNRAFSYTVAGQAIYSDVAETDWFAGEIAKAAAVGYLGGYPDGTVKPQNPITRQEAAALFAKILPPANFGKDKNKDKFTDQAQIPEWSQAAIATAVNGGYMNGYPDGTFQPARPITRAEAISVLDRAVGTLYNHIGTYGSSQGTTLLEGNVTINTTGITLQNTTITGNLYLTEGIGEGDVTLNNVTVQGTTKISGGGSNSIHLLNTTVGNVLVNVPNRNLVRLLAQGSTAVGILEARTLARLEEKGITGSGFTKVVVNTQQAIIAQGGNPQQSSTITVELLGQFGDIEVQSAAAQINLQEGSIQNLTLTSTAQAAQINLAAWTSINTLVAETPAIVQGQGTVEMLEANVDGVVVEAPAKNVILEDGVQATVEGKTITEDYKYTEPKKKKSRDAALSDLAVNGKKVEGFAPDTLDYTVVLPYGTEKAPVVTATARHAKAQVEITQATGLTALNNTATVLVTAESGATREYTVSFTVALDSAKAITGFKFESSQNDLGAEDVIGTIDETAKTITATVPYGTGVTSLTPTITHTGVSISPESGIAQDFTNSVTTPVKYTVTAANGTTAVYDITVYIALNDEVSLSTFKIGGQDVKGLAEVNTEEGAILAISNFTGFKGIIVEATDPNASVTVTLKRGETVTTVTDLANQAIEPYDVIIVTVVAENRETEGKYKVTVEPVSVTGVSLDKSETTLQVGASETLTATVKPAEATNKKVTWSSSDEAIATVVDGVVTAVGAGTATITVTTEDGAKTADCAVSVKAPVTFTVTDVSEAPIAGATVTLGTENKTTDAEGKAVFSALSGNHAYTVTAIGYDEATGTITVEGAAVAADETVALNKSTYPVIFSAEGSGTLTATVDTETINSGDSIEHGKDVVFTAAPNTGYRVQAWKLNGSILGEEKTTSYTLTNLQAAATVTVAFELIPKYIVTYNGNGSTGGTVPIDNNKYEEDVSVTVLDNTGELVKEGYAFAGWNTAADGSGTSYAAGANFSMGTANVTLYAQWTIDCNFTADDVYGETATFTWTAVIEATSIKIQQSTDGGTIWTPATTLGELFSDATTAVVTGLTKNTAYQFKLVVNGGTTAESNSISVTTKAAVMYGASWDSSKSLTTMTRLGDALGKTAGADFNGFSPWSGMKLCNAADNGTINAYLGDAGFKRDGSNGQVMVKIPKFYYKHTYNDTTKVHEFWVADGLTEGFKLHPAFIRAGVEKDYILMGAYKASFGRNQANTADTLASISGVLPAVSQNIGQFRTLAEGRGTKWTQADALTRNAVALLYLVEYADTNSQSTIGQGITGLRYTDVDKIKGVIVDEGTGNTDNDKIIVSYSDTGQYYKVDQFIDVGTTRGARNVWKNRKIIGTTTAGDDTTITVTGGECPGTVAANYILYHVGQKTGGCDGLDGASGSAVSVSYRGLEDLWGNVWEFVDGINIKADHRPYVADHGFASDVFYGTIYQDAGFDLPGTNNWVNNFACSAGADWLLMPSAVGASSAYIPDYYYQATGNRVALVGGNCYDGTNAGLFDWNVSNDSSTAYLAVGARLLLIP